MKRARPALLLSCLAAAACDGSGDGSGQRTAPRPALGPVVAEALAELEARVAAAEPEPRTTTEGDLEQRVDGLLQSLASSSAGDSMRRLVLAELAQIGDPAIGPLSRALADRALEPRLRRAAAEALAAIDTPAAAEVLLARVEGSRTELEPENWLIAQCAWRLGETGQEWVVPRLILCLRYEAEHEAVLWLASTLAHFGNLSGLEALAVVASTGNDEMRPRAAGLLQSIADDAGFERWEDLEAAWRGRPGTVLDEQPPSLRHRLEIWRHIRALSEWQLRGVDDGRFVLSREGRAAAELLGRALGDEDRYVRVHAAQCLERMGRRGAVAGPALVAALDDPEVAHQAAAALGGVRYAPGVEPLIARLSPDRPLELRVAAARALGLLEGQAIAAALRPLLAGSEPLDLRAAAAGALVRTAPLDEVADPLALLVELLESPALEPTEIEVALDDWLLRSVEEDVDGAGELHAAWRAIDDEDDGDRARRRAELLRGRR